MSLRNLRGRPVLVSFFATWCPPCVEEAPSLDKLARRLGDKATVLVVSVDEDLDALKKFYASGSAATVVRDESQKVPASFGTSKFPESFLIDQGGKVRYAFINKRDWSTARSRRLCRGPDLHGRDPCRRLGDRACTGRSGERPRWTCEHASRADSACRPMPAPHRHGPGWSLCAGQAKPARSVALLAGTPTAAHVASKLSVC